MTRVTDLDRKRFDKELQRLEDQARAAGDDAALAKQAELNRTYRRRVLVLRVALVLTVAGMLALLSTVPAIGYGVFILGMAAMTQSDKIAAFTLRIQDRKR